MLKLQGVSKYYRGETTVTQALRRVDAAFNIGEFVVITGESGSGKSTLLNVLSGLDSYEEGEMFINGEETNHYTDEEWEHYRSQYIGFVFQSYNIIDSYTVYQNVMSALIIQGYDPAKRANRAKELIADVGLKAQMHQRSSTLSGGQKQRVSIARALAKDAPIIVADEPTGNLDKASSDAIIQLLKEVSHDRLVIMVTHSYEAVKDQATRHLRLFDGEVVEDKTHKKPTETPEITVKPLYNMPLKDQLKLAFQNLFMMPKRLILMSAISILIVLAIALVYGANVVTTTERSSSPAFNNSSIHRLVVNKWDGSAFSSEELDTLSDLRHVESLIDFDPANEVFLSVLSQYGGLMPYQTNHATGLHPRMIDQGRAPEAINEIVVTRTYGMNIGDTVTVYLSNDRYGYYDAPRDPEQPMQVNLPSMALTVVGFIDDWWDLAYVHPDFYELDSVRYQALRASVEMQFTLDEDTFVTFDNIRIDIDDTLADNTIQVSESLETILKETLNLSASQLLTTPLTFELHNDYLESRETNMSIDAVFEDQYDAVKMSSATKALVFQTVPYQITLIVEDGHSAGLVQERLSSAYHSIYPASYEYPGMANLSIIFNIFNIITITALLMTLYFITYITLKNTMQARKKDYIIFRSIGASKSDLYRMTIYELMMVFMIAFVIVYTFLLFNRYALYWLPDYLRYYSIANYLFVVVLLLGLAILTGLKFNTKIFKNSVITALRVE